MVISLTEQKANHVIVVSMPLPKADDVVSQSLSLYHCLVAHIFQQTWDTRDGDYVAKPYDHFEEVAPMAALDLSAKAQITSILIFVPSSSHTVFRLVS